MSDLVGLDDMKAFLGDPKSATQEVGGVLDKTLTQVIGLLEHECNRELTPFAAAAMARAEIHDGTGRDTLFLDYPVETVLDAVLGHDVLLPEARDLRRVPQVVERAGR